VTPSRAALFGWAFNPAIRDLDPPPAVAATVDRRGRGQPLHRFKTRCRCCDLRFGRMSRLRQDRGLCPFGCSA
jgi:hypothetical protein